jgi:hypothetical protein
MVTIVLIIWLLVGIGVIIFGIKKKKKYGYRSRFHIGSLVIMVVAAFIWPLVIILIIKFIKEQEAAINKVLKENPKYTREGILRGGKILH